MFWSRVYHDWRCKRNFDGFRLIRLFARSTFLFEFLDRAVIFGFLLEYLVLDRNFWFLGFVIFGIFGFLVRQFLVGPKGLLFRNSQEI